MKAGAIRRLIFVALALFPAAALAQESPRQVTLDAAVNEALQHNALLGAARADVNAKEGQFREARSYFIPDISLSEMASRTNNPVYVFMGKLTQSQFAMQDFALDRLNNPDPLTNYQTKFELAMPLFTGGKLKAAYKATKWGIESARQNVSFAESSTARAVTEAFYGSLLAQEAAEVMGEAAKTARAHLNQVEAMYKQDLVLDSDLMRIRVYASDVEQQEAARKADAEVARAYLGYAMGASENVAPLGSFVVPAEPLPALEEAMKRAIEARPDLKATAIQRDQASEGVKMARADYLPQAGLMASYEWDTEKWARYGDNWQVGIQLKVPLFDGGARAGRLETAKAQSLQAEQALKDLREKVAVQAKEAWLRARAADERVSVTTGAVAQAQENQRIVELRYKEGLASITDLLDADMALTAAKLSRNQAIHDALVERANLAWATGEPLPGSMK